MLSVLLLLSGALLSIRHNQEAISEVDLHRSERIQIAEELQTSADGLARMARAYIDTLDPRYDAYYREIVKIRKDEQLPADIVVLKSEKQSGIVFVDTMNLDGEVIMFS